MVGGHQHIGGRGRGNEDQQPDVEGVKVKQVSHLTDVVTLHTFQVSRWEHNMDEGYLVSVGAP